MVETVRTGDFYGKTSVAVRGRSRRSRGTIGAGALDCGFFLLSCATVMQNYVGIVL